MKRYGFTRAMGDLDYAGGSAGIIMPLFDRFGATAVWSAHGDFASALVACEPLGPGEYEVVRAHCQLVTASPTASAILAIVNAKQDVLVASATAAYGATHTTAAAAPWFDVLNLHARFPWVRVIGTDGDHEGYSGGRFKIDEAGFPVLLRGFQGEAVVANAEGTCLIEIAPV